jgi:hypothetical protein
MVRRVSQGEDKDTGPPFSIRAFGKKAMLLTRQPEELFAAEDELDWQGWVAFFSRTHEWDGRRKGLVEIAL